MDLALTEDQQILRETTERFLQRECTMSMVRAWSDTKSGYDQSWWHKAAELGWLAMLVPETDGGGNVSGAGILDLMIIAEELGTYVAPGPFVATNVMADALARFGSPQQKMHLPDLVEGGLVAAWCCEPFIGAWRPEYLTVEAVVDGSSIVLNGVAAPAEAAQTADLILVTARTGDAITQVVVPRETEGLGVTGMQSVDLVRRFDEVRFVSVRLPSSAVLGEVGCGQSAAQRQALLAATLNCAETVGIARRVFEFTLDYVKGRYSFGRPLASYQAIKHRFAEMELWLEAAQAITIAAGTALQNGSSEATELASAAKTYVGERSTEIVQECVQLHGGIAMTWEHNLHVYLRRATLNRNLHGTPNEHRRLIATSDGVD